MKESYWAYFIIILGISIITIMMLVQRMTATTEEDYYLSREVLESSMIDAIDYGTYRTTGKVIMSEQKFIEVFVRRFAASVANNKTYELSFYDIYEDPPKATVKIRTSNGSTALGSESFDIKLDTTLSGIVETIYGVSDKIDNPVPPSSSSSSSSTSSSSGGRCKKWTGRCYCYERIVYGRGQGKAMIGDCTNYETTCEKVCAAAGLIPESGKCVCDEYEKPSSSSTRPPSSSSKKSSSSSSSSAGNSSGGGSPVDCLWNPHAPGCREQVFH